MVEQLSIFDAPVLGDDMDDAANKVLADLREQGINPRAFLLRYMQRLTLAKLEPFTQAEKERFAVELLEEICKPNG